MDQDKIGKFIAKCRKERNITQQELANKLGVTDKAISKWETGRCLMDISLLKPISEILGVSILEIINGENIEKERVYMKSNEVVEKTLNYAKEKIKKSKIKSVSIVVLLTFLVAVIGFVSYKGIMLVKYNVEPIENYEELINSLSMDETLKIYKRTINENEYLKNKDIKIRNDFDDYELIDSALEYDSTKYLLYNDNGEVESAFWMGSMDQYINIFTSDSLTIYGTKDNGQFSDADRKYFLLKNDINDDIDFFKYIKNNYYLKNTMFTNIRKMKENYAVNLFVQIALPSFDSMTLISGDYTGYIYNLNNRLREVHILKHDKSYVFTFMGEKLITDEYICDLLSTLEIQ